MIDAINSIDLKKENDVPCLPSLSTVPHMQRRKRGRAIGLEGGMEKMARMEKNGLELFQNVVREQKDKADLFVIDDFFWIVCCIGEMEGKPAVGKMEFIDSTEDRELIQTFFDATPEDVLKLIEQTVLLLLKQITQREEPSLSVVARSNKNAVFCKREQQLRLRLGTVKRRLSDGKRFQGLVKILQICYALGREKKTVNQRELYYMNTDVSIPYSSHSVDLFHTARVRRLYPGLHRSPARSSRCFGDFSHVQRICNRKVETRIVVVEE